jgi:acetyl esterase
MTAPDYQSLIDAETWAFIAETEACYPPESADQSIAAQRAVYDAMCRHFHHGYPPGVAAHDKIIGGVRCRCFLGAGPTVLYLHGGGGVLGGLDSHDDICAELHAQTGLTVILPDYRLSPEHRHPAAYDDCQAVALAIPGPLILVGDSAGATLAAALAQSMRNARLLGQILVYPSLGGPEDSPSYHHHAHAPLLSAADLRSYAQLCHGDGPRLPDPTAAPLHSTDYSGLPPTLALAAECDPLCDDASLYAARIRAAGGKAKAITEPGLVHGYLRARHRVARARSSFQRISQTLAAFAQAQWRFDDPA